MGSPLFNDAKLQASLRLIEATPGFADVGRHLFSMEQSGRILFEPKLEDRAQAGLLGTITLGPEAIQGSVLSLAQTLVHEYFHLRQNPFLKTVSFWSGVFTRTHPMKRFEEPAYAFALEFLDAVQRARPELIEEAQAEQRAVRQVFESTFGSALRGN
jgi:hypothetical protein